MNRKELEFFFKDFPGVGPRQAKRFVSSLLYKEENYLKKMSSLILNIKDNIKRCFLCTRFFEATESSKNCSYCSDKSRDEKKILVIERNTDLENIESFNVWDGYYFLIGKNLKLTEKKPEDVIKLDHLINRLKDGIIKELTLALSLNIEGEHTKEYIKKIIQPICLEKNIKITELGRGLSLGSEIEYSDSLTLSAAIKNRK